VVSVTRRNQALTYLKKEEERLSTEVKRLSVRSITAEDVVPSNELVILKKWGVDSAYGVSHSAAWEAVVESRPDPTEKPDVVQLFADARQALMVCHEETCLADILCVVQNIEDQIDQWRHDNAWMR